MQGERLVRDPDLWAYVADAARPRRCWTEVIRPKSLSFPRHAFWPPGEIVPQHLLSRWSQKTRSTSQSRIIGATGHMSAAVQTFADGQGSRQPHGLALQPFAAQIWLRRFERRMPHARWPNGR